MLTFIEATTLIRKDDPMTHEMQSVLDEARIEAAVEEVDLDDTLFTADRMGCCDMMDD
jgi:hypothetical protein